MPSEDSTTGLNRYGAAEVSRLGHETGEGLMIPRSPPKPSGRGNTLAVAV